MIVGCVWFSAGPSLEFIALLPSSVSLSFATFLLIISYAQPRGRTLPVRSYTP
jgi:hypothetical protein